MVEYQTTQDMTSRNQNGCAGSDSSALWARWLYAAAIFAVALAAAYRLLQVAGTEPVHAKEPRVGGLGGMRAARVASPAQVAASGASSLDPRGVQWAPGGGGENGREASEETATL